MDATTTKFTAYQLPTGFFLRRKTLNIKTEEEGGLYRYLVCRDDVVIRKGDAIYSDQYEAFYAGYVLERQLIADGALYE